MTPHLRLIALLVLVATATWITVILVPTFPVLADPPNASAGPVEANAEVVAPPSVVEARARARMLHEMVRGTLQIIHRDFFDEDDAHAIPSASLEDVFHEMSIEYDVTMKWLIVRTDVLNVDHEPEGEFENRAVDLLAKGKPFVEQSFADRYQFAGAIPLGTQCLKCHVKRRTTNEDRTSGLVITMPIKIPEKNSHFDDFPDAR